MKAFIAAAILAVAAARPDGGVKHVLHHAPVHPPSTLSTPQWFTMPPLLLTPSTLPPLMPQLPLLTSPLPLTRPRPTPMRSPPTPSPTPSLMTTPRLTSTLRSSPMVPATLPDLTPSLFPMAESST